MSNPLLCVSRGEEEWGGGTRACILKPYHARYCTTVRYKSGSRHESYSFVSQNGGGRAIDALGWACRIAG